MDQAAGFTYEIDWNGDGVIDQVEHGPRTFQIDHMFDQPGAFTVLATATDKDGGKSDVASHFITVVAPGEVPYQDVSDLVDIHYSNTTFNRRTGEQRMNVVVSNITSPDVHARLLLLVSSISTQDVTLVNPDGMRADGDAYFDLSPLVGADLVLSAGESTEAVDLVFSNPKRLRFTFDPLVVEDPLGLV